MLSKTSKHIITVVIVDCTHIGSDRASLGLGNIGQENTIAYILIQNQIWPTLDMVTVDLEQEIHKPNG